MRGYKMLVVLDTLLDMPGEVMIAFESFLSAGYGASGAKIANEYRRIMKESRKSSRKHVAFKKDMQRYRNFISYLKRDGLIAENHKGVIVTPKGHRKVEKLKKGQLSLPNPASYKRSTGEKVVIFSFDIPENVRHKRNWLRDVLKNLGFRMVQKSLFIGKGSLPKDFLGDLKTLNLTDGVEIFEVSKAGTLRNIL